MAYMASINLKETNKLKQSSINLFITLSILFYGVIANATLLPIVDDSFVNDLTLTSQGSSPNIVIDPNPISTGYVKFDITALDILESADEVELAQLRIWVKRVDTAGSVELYVIDEDWDEASLVASNAPLLVGGPVATFDVASSALNDFLLIDITEQVRAWVDAPETNYGFALVSIGASVNLDSKENSQTAHEMAIDVVLRGPQGEQGEIGLTGADGPQGETGTQGETECSVCVELTSNSDIDGEKECSDYSSGGIERPSPRSEWAEANLGTYGGGKYAARVSITCRQK